MSERFVMIDETWYTKPPGISEHEAAGGVIVRLEDNSVYIALVREKGLSDYILPKGRVEKGESVEEAARREIEEESGLTDLRLAGELGVRERLDYSKRAWKKTHYFLYLTEQVEGTPTDLKHHYKVEWFRIDNLPPLFWPEQKELIETNRGRIMKLPNG